MNCPLCHELKNPHQGRLLHKSSHFSVIHKPSPSAVVGWILILPNRHIEDLSDFTDEERADLFHLQFKVSDALKIFSSAERIYWAVFAEKVRHIHFHLIPRLADTPDEFRGPKVFQSTHAVKDEMIDNFCQKFSHFIGSDFD